MKNQNSPARTTSWWKALGVLSVFSIIGSLMYLGGVGKDRPGMVADSKLSVGSLDVGLDGGQPSPRGESSVGRGSKESLASEESGPVLTMFSPAAPAEGARLGTPGQNAHQDKGRVMRLNPKNLSVWGGLRQGTRILLPSFSEEPLEGTVNLVLEDNGWIRIGGSLDQQRGSFNLSSNGSSVEGAVLFPELAMAHEIRTENTGVFLVERRLSHVLCSPNAPGKAMGIPRSAEPVGRATTAQVIPELNTRPGAKGIIFADFKGGVVNSTRWNGGKAITAAASPLSGDQIKEVVNRVAEMFAAFDVTITTIPNVYYKGDTFNGGTVGGGTVSIQNKMRAVVTPTDTAEPGSGGVAYIGDWSSSATDKVCWVFNQGVKSCADTIAHEVGHTLGLYHDGNPAGEYYKGHGGGLKTPTSWGPIMGAPFDVTLSQWSKGEYAGATNSEDDLAIIAASLPRRVDSPLVTPQGAVKTLALLGTMFEQSGLLTSGAFSDVYQFNTLGGKFSASVRPYSNLSVNDLRLTLLDMNGTILQQADAPEILGAALSTSLPAGFYRLRVEPAGSGPKPEGGYKLGYSEYGSVGRYVLSGLLEGSSALPAFISSTVIVGTVQTAMNVRIEATDGSTVTILNKENLPPGLTATVGSVNACILSGTPTAVTGGVAGRKTLLLSAKNKFGETRTEFNIVINEISLGLSAPLGAGGPESAVSGVVVQAEAPWIGVQRPLLSGTAGIVAQSGAIGDKGSTSLKFSLKLPSNPGSSGGTVYNEATKTWTPASSAETVSYLSFYWRASSEAAKDKVVFKLGGVVQRDAFSGQSLELSGNRPEWIKQTVRLTGGGTRSAEFVYTKDANLRDGEDRVWVYGLELGQPPVVKTSPKAAVRVTPGDSADSKTLRLSCEVYGVGSDASGNPNPVVWWKNGVPITVGNADVGRIEMTSERGPGIDPATVLTSGTLVIRNVTAADAGVYWAVAKNSYDSVSTGRAEVSVWSPPLVTAQPVVPAVLRVGDPLSLSATVSGAQPMFYQWKRNGVVLTGPSSSPVLYLSKTTKESAGRYVLVATNQYGTVSSKEIVVGFTLK